MEKSDIINKAYEDIFQKKIEKKTILKYYNSFKGYNATVRSSISIIEFHLSSKWKEISDDIKIGLIQSLLIKIFVERKKRHLYKSLNIELYDIFLKKIHHSIPKNESDQILMESFMRVNEEYFNGIIEECNLSWGLESKRKLGSYDYTSDIIKISSIFKKHIPEKNYLLDYVMYHEMLHKKLKFNDTLKGKRYHTLEFRNLEKKFKNSEQCEKELSYLGTYLGVKKNNKNKLLELFGF